MAEPNTQEESAFRFTPSLEQQRIARVYAEALHNIARDEGVVDQVKAELVELVSGAFREEPRFEAFLESSAVSREHKERVLRTALESRCSSLFFRFLLVLNSHDRLSILRALLHEFLELDNRRNKRLPVLVRTAVPLSVEHRERLTQDLRIGFGLEPQLETQVDPDILGGMILQVGDFVMDASVRGEIEAMRKQLLSRGNHVIQSGRDRFSNPA
jgi:F-type H+-transporting ATPase subunit delta